MSKNFYKTAEGLIFNFFNNSDEKKFILELQDIELEELNRKNENGKSLGIIAVENHKHEVLKFLIEKGIDLTIKNGAEYDLLFICMMRGNYEGAKLLLEKHNFTESISSTLDYGVLPISSQNIDIIKLLIEKGGVLSKYHFDYLFDTKNDCKLRYDRDEIRNFYQKNLNSGDINIFSHEEILSLTNDTVNTSEDTETVGLNGVINLQDQCD